MMEFELASVSRQVVEGLADVESDEEVLLITDPANESVARSLTTAARSTGAIADLIVMPKTAVHGAEPTDAVAAAMKAVDVAVMATTHSFTHTRARLDAAVTGTRIVIMRGVSEDLMIHGGINTDYEWLAETTANVRDVLDDATTAHVVSEAGTDVTMDLRGRSAFALDGLFHDYGFSALPPGESPTSPVEGSTEGTIVFDYSVDNVGLLEAPIGLVIEGGTVVEIRGEKQADELRELLDDADENARNIAEFAIGTNPDARLVGNLAEDKKRLGTVHFAVGDDESLGGSVRSNIHLDGVVLEPSVWLDDEQFLKDGTADVEKFARRAAEIRGK